MTHNLYFITVFLEGLASFLSPCVLPLIPVYLTYLTGQSVKDIQNDSSKGQLILNSIGFVLGFSIVFIGLGAGATSIGQFLRSYQFIIGRVSSILIIIFGLFHADFIDIPLLNREGRRRPKKSSAPSFFASLLLGMGFSFGWTPCIGPILTSVLLMASSAETVSTGMALLGVYSLGLGIPFIVMALLMGTMWDRFKKLYEHMNLIKRISGILLMAIGVLMLFNII